MVQKSRFCLPADIGFRFARRAGDRVCGRQTARSERSFDVTDRADDGNHCHHSYLSSGISGARGSPNRACLEEGKSTAHRHTDQQPRLYTTITKRPLVGRIPNNPTASHAGLEERLGRSGLSPPRFSATMNEEKARCRHGPPSPLLLGPLWTSTSRIHAIFFLCTAS